MWRTRIDVAATQVRPGRRRNHLNAAWLCAAAITIAGCGSSEFTASTGASASDALVAEPSSIAAASPLASTEAAFEPTFTTYVARGANNEDVPITATILIDRTLYPASDLVADARYSTLLSACGEVDKQRDAIRLASIELTADSNGFDTQAGVVVSFVNADGMIPDITSSQYAKFGPSAVEYAVGYDDPQCSTTRANSLFLGTGAAIPAPADGSSTAPWGPVDVAFIIRGYYGPSHPKSNPLLSDFLDYAIFGIGNAAPYDPISGSQTSDVLATWNPTKVKGPGRSGQLPGSVFPPTTGGPIFRLK